MPELPDVELERRRLDETSGGRRVTAVGPVDPYMSRGTSERDLRSALLGARLGPTARIGKNLFVRLEDAGPGGGPTPGAERGWLALHFGMTGALRRLLPGEAAPPATRLLLALAGGGGLALLDQRRLGRVALAASPEAFASVHGLGPDALDPALTEAAFLGRLAGRTACVKALLLDQSFVAGVGNIYADEVLLAAHIAPLTPAARLAEDARRRLYRRMREVLATAIDAGAGPSRMPREWLLRDRREGAPCPRGCGGTVARVRIGGRSSYWCPACQRA